MIVDSIQYTCQAYLSPDMSTEAGKKRRTNEEDFPCKEEKRLSLLCLDQNDYDNSKCERAFANYKFCRKFWSIVETERTKANVKPACPAKAEREAIRKYYKETGRLPNFKKENVFKEDTSLP